jgi:toxin-antitoxin system PIN domain toxin
MTIPDLNILLHAANPSSPRHAACKDWIESTLNSGGDALGLAWAVHLGFIRIATSPRVYPNPMKVEEACAWLDELRSHPLVRPIDPGAGHAAILRHLLLCVGTGGNLTTDAHLAALALERDATLATGDRDFQRFPGLGLELLY